MSKERQHNEWFRVVSLNGRKSCPTCLTKIADGEQCWSWGEYVAARWRTVKHFCAACFSSEVLALLQQHSKPCGCTIILQCRENKRPSWLVEKVEP